nr:MAG TPA: hypothetical protein [Caudoviricetes sp.]
MWVKWRAIDGGCSRGTACNSVFPAACASGTAKDQQITIKPPGHCPGGFSFCPRPDLAWRCPFAMPTWGWAFSCYAL